MKWRYLAACLFGLAGGCMSEGPILPVAANPAPTIARLQKPEKPVTSSISPAGFLDTPPESGNKDTQVIATVRAIVNGVPILESEVRNACYYPLQQTNALAEPERSQKQKEILTKALDPLIERELVLQEATQRFKGPAAKYLEKVKEAAAHEFDQKIARALKAQYALKNDDEFKDLLRRQGTSLASLRKQHEKQFIYQEYLRSRAGPAIERVGAEQIRQYYQLHPDEFQQNDNLDWLDIFIAANRYDNRQVARQLAEQVLTRARAGEDFAALVRQYDNGDSSYRNGEGNGHRRGEIKPPEVEPYLFDMKDGELGPVIEIGNGFHIVKLVKRDYAGQVGYDEKTQAKIRQKLQGEIFMKEAKRIIADMKRHATIEIATTP